MNFYDTHKATPAGLPKRPLFCSFVAEAPVSSTVMIAFLLRNDTRRIETISLYYYFF